MTQESLDVTFASITFLFETRRMNNMMTFKGNFENLTSCQSHDLTGKDHIAYQSIRIVELNTTEFFIALACIYQKLFKKKNSCEPFMTWDNLWNIINESVTGAMFLLSVLILSVSQCLRLSRMALVQKRCLLIFSHRLTYT